MICFFRPSLWRVRSLVVRWCLLSCLMGSLAAGRGFFNANAKAFGILVPWPRIKPMSPAWQGGFLTTGPPGITILWMKNRGCDIRDQSKVFLAELPAVPFTKSLFPTFPPHGLLNLRNWIRKKSPLSRHTQSQSTPSIVLDSALSHTLQSFPLQDKD